MVSGAGEGSTAPARRPLVAWGIAFGLLAIAFFGTVLVLNSTLYSASGFVSSYLSALERRDVAAALAMPGIEAEPDASDALLRRDALGELGDIELVRDTDAGGGEHRVTFAYSFEGEETGRTTFVVQHTGPRLGLFSSWEFEESPLTVVEITPQNASELEVNGVPVVAAAGPNLPSAFQLLVPGSLTLDHESTYLEAEETTVHVTAPQEPAAATLEVRASDEFVEAVEEELAAYLDECATQEVLQPTGCPFGRSINNRVDGPPEWSILDYPRVAIHPSEQAGLWAIPASVGTAHLSVDVISLFDGTVSRLDEDVTFTISYLVALGGEDGPTLIPQ